MGLLTKPNIVPFDILRTEFAATVGLIAQPVIYFRAALDVLLIESIDVVDPEVHSRSRMISPRQAIPTSA